MRSLTTVRHGIALLAAVTGAALLGPAGTASAAAQPAAGSHPPAVHPTTVKAASTSGVTPAAAAALPDLYVSQCTGTGDGSPSNPFCSVSAAAAVAQPGQTVLVSGGNYAESLTITKSGTPGAPITFLALNGRLARVSLTSAAGTAALSLTGVHDVVVRGFDVSGARADAVSVNSSSNITIDEGTASANSRGTAAVRITGASDQVTISRMSLSGSAAGISVEAGANGTTLTTDDITVGSGSVGISVADATGTVITSNTVDARCSPGIRLTGAATGTTLENTIVSTGVRTGTGYAACVKPPPATAVTIPSTALSGTKVDYNLVDPTGGGPLYSWGGTNYTDISAFRTATGQGAHDLAANAQLQPDLSGRWHTLAANSPAIDSADGNAPGELPTDLMDNAHADDPAVTNTGTGVGYADRGAVEQQGPHLFPSTGLMRTPGGAPQETTFSGLPGTGEWATDGPVGKTSLDYDTEPYLHVVRPVFTDRHIASHSGQVCVQVTWSMIDFRSTIGQWTTSCQVVGAGYTPLTPARVLDTRVAVGVGTTTPVGPGADVVVPLPSIAGVPASAVTAVALNVTVTQPTRAGFLTVYPDGASLPTVSNLNFTPGQTRANLAVVPLKGAVRFHNGSPGTVHLVADLQGYYAGDGLGFKPLSPTRVLDTRSRTGVATTTPVAAGGSVDLDLTRKLPAGATAVALTVTAVSGTSSGFVTAYPAGAPRPWTSNLNYLPGQAVPNLVMVGLTAGHATLYNGSGGTVHLIADLAGYFGTLASGAADYFLPYGPVRLLDTRQNVPGGYPPTPQGPVPARGTVTATPLWLDYPQYTCSLGCPLPDAAILNITVTQPRAAGYLTAYPTTQSKPLASNLNFVAGQTVAALTTVARPASAFTAIYNGSPGTVQIVVDEQGYYLPPA